jgi:hypothetical protein
MNKKQKRALWLGTFAIVVMLVFPPYTVVQTSYDGVHERGPFYFDVENKESSRGIRYGRLLLQGNGTEYKPKFIPDGMIIPQSVVGHWQVEYSLNYSILLIQIGLAVLVAGSFIAVYKTE